MLQACFPKGMSMSKLRAIVVGFAFLSMASSVYSAAVGGYVETVLLTNATDPHQPSALVNPWGISFSATSPIWISDNGTGKSTLYNGVGVQNTGLVVSMPAGSFDVSGQVFSGNAGAFNGDTFIFATEDGTITGWRGALGTNAEQLFSVAGASYKGLAINAAKNLLYAANFTGGTIDVFNSSGLQQSIKDTSIPAGYAPFNIQNLNGTFYVTFAKQGPGIDDVAGPGNGFVAIFNPNTDAFTTLVSNGPLSALNSPWGLALAPTTFGALSDDLLVGNFGDGAINAFDPLSGTYLGTLGDVGGSPIINDGLWGLAFGNGAGGASTSSLYLTAGPNDEADGVFAEINATPEPSTMLLGLAGLSALLVGRRMMLRS
jgi:uncharacterized protein (TIGR03118 family)